MAKDVIIACDFPNAAATMVFLEKFGDARPYVKIGMELFYGEGPEVVRQITERGHPVFLDLKLHDIPNTVYKSMKNIARLGVSMTNLHAAGGSAMMAAALQGLQESALGSCPLLIAVTQLTSINKEMMNTELAIPGEVADVAAAYAANAKAAGLDGVVCSPLEVQPVKQRCGDDFYTITPGIRYPDGDKGDQQRVTSPAKAAALGSDYIVVGRTITAAADPLLAYRQVCQDFLQA